MLCPPRGHQNPPPPPPPPFQERFYFGDQVLPLFESGIPLLRCVCVCLCLCLCVCVCVCVGGSQRIVVHAFSAICNMLCRCRPLTRCLLMRCRKRLSQLPDAENITIAYPDEGAWKRFHYQFGDYPEVRLGLGLGFNE